MPADLTHDATLTGQDATLAYGLECAEHPAAKRMGLTQPHATNAVAKHNRDHHATRPGPSLNVTALAQLLLNEYEDMELANQETDPDKGWGAFQARRRWADALNAWTVLTGLPYDEALEFARSMAKAVPPVVAPIAPF